ncbi:hypothetical protein DSO57_1032169 [Entomophthora muscae]|uniref:Uncharacterized protein n=1 Tax=Entomophthora muscae TaxID=34485 RepID=A0ACC2TBM4_9FUNG|nr:hypothetical protein DSO57_1032169 [Entomophthora muscae]
MPRKYEHQVFPRVPDFNDPDFDRNDPVAIIEARAQAVREDWVKVYEARIIRDVLARCYKTEGVNHYQHCRHLAEAYLERLQTHRVGGLRRGPSEHNAPFG